MQLRAVARKNSRCTGKKLFKIKNFFRKCWKLLFIHEFMRKTVFRKLKSPMKSRSTSNRPPLNPLVYISTLRPEIVVVCGLVATVRVCRTVWVLVRSAPVGVLSKICKPPSVVEILFSQLYRGERESLRGTCLKL